MKRALDIIERTFDAWVVDTSAQVSVVRDAIADTRPSGERMVLPSALEELLGRRPKQGAIIAVEGEIARFSLAMTLLSGVSAAGGWCGVIGVPDFGLLAAADFGVRLETLMLVDEPGARWPDVLAAVLGAASAVLVRPPERVPGRLARRLAAKAREARCTVVTLGPAWEGSDVRISAVRQEWFGLGDRHGHLRARRVTAVASTRPGAETALWLPAEDGGLAIDATPRTRRHTNVG